MRVISYVLKAFFGRVGVGNVGNGVYIFESTLLGRGAYTGATGGGKQITCFESWFNCFPVENTLYLEQRVEQILLLQTVNSLKNSL